MKLVFLMLPVIGAWRLCEDGSCVGSRQSRIMAGDITEQNSRPFQVRRDLIQGVGTERTVAQVCCMRHVALLVTKLKTAPLH